jgi:hypothetical protein
VQFMLSLDQSSPCFAVAKFSHCAKPFRSPLEPALGKTLGAEGRLAPRLRREGASSRGSVSFLPCTRSGLHLIE